MSRELGRITLLWEEMWMLKLRDMSKDIQSRWKSLLQEARDLKGYSEMSLVKKIRIFREKFETVMRPIAIAFERVANLTIERGAETFHEKMFVKRFENDVRLVLCSFRNIPDDIVIDLVSSTTNGNNDHHREEKKNESIMMEDNEVEDDENIIKDELEKETHGTIKRVWKHLHRLHRRLRDCMQKNHTHTLSMHALSHHLSSWASQQGGNEDVLVRIVCVCVCVCDVFVRIFSFSFSHSLVSLSLSLSTPPSPSFPSF